MTAFDPYHKWLGIPPNEQPPNHYRLLGLSRFESDPDVIDAATNRQMAFVQQCAAGPYIDASQKLLNELSAARICLLMADKKLAYDQQLRDELAEAEVQLIAQPKIFRSQAGGSAQGTRRATRIALWVISGLIFAAIVQLAGFGWPSWGPSAKEREISRIVLWNQHNGQFNNGGTRTCNLILLSKGKEVWRKADFAVPWQPDSDVAAAVEIPRVLADKLRIEITAWHQTAGGLAEVQVFTANENIAAGCPAKASAEHRQGDSRSADKLTDGNTSSSREMVGYWLLPVAQAGWVEIQLPRD
jgi:hypothetical protein